MSEPTYDVMRAWNSRAPIVWRVHKSAEIMLRMPYSPYNRSLLTKYRGHKPRWDKQQKHWTLPASRFSEICRFLLEEFGQVYVIQPRRTQEKCAPACWSAHGLECECSCMGQNHGNGQPGGRWYEVSNACAVKWGELEYYLSLLKVKPKSHAREVCCETCSASSPDDCLRCPNNNKETR